MANVTARCQLMQNAFPAGPLSLQGSFYVVEDVQGEHMIFSIDKRDKLCLVVKGSDGHNELINLSTSLGLADSSKITALAVTQSRWSQVHLTFAASGSDGHDNLHVMKPMPAERKAWLDPAALKAALYTGQLSNVSISDILMGNGNGQTDAVYPELFVTVELAGKVDIWAITVTNSTASWKRESKEAFQLPCTPDMIVSKCIGNIGNPKDNVRYHGLFVLYKDVDSTVPLQLRFAGLDSSLANPTLQAFEQPVPPNARVLASFDNPEGFTDLLVCADTLLWRSARDCYVQSEAPYRKPLAYQSSAGEIFSGPLSPLDIKQVSVAQAGDKISLWTLDQSSLLSYQEFQIFGRPRAGDKTLQSPPQELSPPIPLLKEISHSNRFASIQNPRFGQKLFVISDNSITMSMLQQSVETRMWQSPIDVMIPHSDEIREFMSHTVSILVEDESNMLLHDQELLLCCSSSAEMLVNGISVRGSPTGIVVKTDEQGSITVVIPADGIAAPVLTVKDVPGTSSVLGGRTIDIDPMQKLWNEMEQIKTVKDLLNLKLPDGTPFVKAEMSKKDLEKAVQAIQDMCKARQELASGGSQVVTMKAASADRQWGAWFWIKNQVREAYDWSVDKIGTAWKFIVRIAGQVWEFIVENYPQIAEVMQKILEAVSKGWEWVKNKLEEVFPWNDILAVKNALVNITTAGVIMGADVFANLEQKADECFDDLRKKVRKLKNETLPKELTDICISKTPPAPEGMNNKDIAEIVKSPQFQYTAYHLRHSASKQSGSSGVISPRSEGETSFDRLYKRLSGIWDSVITLAAKFGTNIVDLFSNEKFGLDVLLAKVGLELAEDALGVLQKAVTALLGSLNDLLLELADAMNADIKIPVIGPLYSRLTKNSRFTALDTVCLLLAIPSTIAYKKIIGPLPKEERGYQQLTKPDALKGALDLRMGRIKGGEVVKAPRTNQPAASHMGMMNFHQAPGGMTDTVTIGGPNHGLSQAVMEQAKVWFAEVRKPGSFILKCVFPVCSLLYTTAYKLPAAMAAGEAGNGGAGAAGAGEGAGRKASWKLLLKLVHWVGHGIIICWPKFKDMSKTISTLAKIAFEDVVFGWKFILWSIPGILPVVGHLINERLGHAAEIIGGITQTIGLVAMHVDVYAIEKASYPWYKCPEEYINALAKVAVAAAVMSQCKEPYSLGFAYGLTGVGKLWTTSRVRIEFELCRNDDKDRSIAVDDTV
ncbi:hypothetical protein MMC18_008864 [Xylographa bjoerkii]|nr:hypothetical protein [Xylographa bjoerkii]